jgi:hypothetical protein
MSHDGGKSLRDRIARSKQVVKSRKTFGQKIVKETVLRRSIALSEMQVGRPVRWGILSDKGAGFAITERTTLATGFTDGRASTNVVSYESMKQSTKEATPFQHAEQPLPTMEEKHWKTGTARSERVGEQDLGKRQTLVKELSHTPIPLEMKRVGRPVRGRISGDKGTPIADPTQQLRHTDRVDTGPTQTVTLSGCEGVEVLQDRIVRLEQVVDRLKAELGNRRTLLDERVSGLEQINKARKAESRKRKETCNPLSKIQGARLAWSALLGGQGATLTQAEAITLWSDEEEESEEEGQGEQPKNGTHPVQGTQPTCSKLYCSRMTIAFKSGKWKKQCEHCISLSKNKKL